MGTIEYEAVTDPTSRAWQQDATVHVVGAADGWVVFAGVLPGRRYEIGELRILPMDGSLPRDGIPMPAMNVENERGSWSGNPLRVPAGGIPSDLLRAIHLGEIQAAARAWMIAHGIETGGADETWRRTFAAVRRHLEQDALRPLTVDERLAVLAAEYVDLLDDPATKARSNEVLAERHDRTPGWAGQEVYRARQKGFLEPRKPGRGRPKGRLTARAKDVLDRLHDEENER